MSYWFRHRLMKFNPHHDNEGKFASADGAGAAAEASKLVDKATTIEPSVSKALEASVPEYAKLDEFDFRLKTLASTTRKIGKYMVEGNMSLAAAAARIKDSLRYTVILPEDKYVEGIKKTLGGMTAAGFTIPSFRNTWGTPIYQGVNTNLRTPDGHILEVQFHTDDSLSTKLQNHVEYEVERQVSVSNEDRERTNAIMMERQSKVHVPKGALGYVYG